MTRRALTAYVAAIGAGAMTFTAMLPAAGLAGGLGALLTLAVLGALVGSRSVRIPQLRIQATAGDAFTFCALVAVGPLAAPLVALAGTIGACLGKNRRPLSIRTAFNLGAVTLSGAMAGWAFVAVTAGHPGNGLRQALALAIAGIAFFVTNTLLVAGAIRLEKGGSFLGIWWKSGLWGTASALASVLLAAGLLWLVAAIGLVALAVGLAGSAMLVSAYRAHALRVRGLDPAAQTG